MHIKPTNLHYYTFILWLFWTMHTHAQRVDDSTYSYECYEKTMDEVSRDLEKLMQVRIYYNPETIAEKYISLSLQNATKKEVLAALVQQKNFTYQLIQDDLIVLVSREHYAMFTGEMNDYSGSYVDYTTTVVGTAGRLDHDKMATVKGMVKEGATGDILIGATVQIENTNIGVSSDLHGNFTVRLKPGIYMLEASSIGFEKSQYKIKVLGNGSINIDLYETTHSINEVSVFAESADKNIRNSQVGMLELDAKSIKNLPGVTGEKDLIKSMVTMPGIQSVGEFGSGINVRGGGEDQTLYLVEGSPLFNTSHVFGLMSVINPDAVSSVALYKGHMPAELGERASSVMDIEIRDNAIEKLNLSGGLGIYNSRLMIGTPVGDHLSFKVGLRKNYSNWILQRLKDYNLKHSRADFYDLTSSLNFSKGNNRVVLFGYLSRDAFNYANDLKYDYGNMLSSLRWNRSYNQVLSSEILFSVSNYDVSRDEVDNASNSRSISSEIMYQTGKLQFKYIGLANHTLLLGSQFTIYNVMPGKQSPVDSISLINEIELPSEKAYETALYVKDEFQISDNLSVNAGIRFSNYFRMGPDQVYTYDANWPVSEQSITDSSSYKKGEVATTYQNIEPRISLVYMLPTQNSVKFSYARTSQYISLVTFTSISMPDNTWKLADEHFKPIKSNQFSIGYFQNFKNNNIETSAEIYYKFQDNLYEIKNDANIYVNGNLEREVIPAIGKNYGLELYLRKKDGKLNGTLSYTFSRSLRKTNGTFASEIINKNAYFASAYDKPHDLFMDATYHINKRWAISGNFTYSTGRPVNIPEYSFNFAGQEVAYYTDRNKYRLPDYHRFDVSVHLYETLRLKKKWKGNWTLTVMNVYGRKNAYSVFYKREKPTIENDYKRFSMYKVYLIGIPLPTLTYNFVF